MFKKKNEEKARYYKKQTEWGVIIKVRVRLEKIIAIDRQGHPLQKSWQRYGYDSAFAPAGAIGGEATVGCQEQETAQIEHRGNGKPAG